MAVLRRYTTERQKRILAVFDRNRKSLEESPWQLDHVTFAAINNVKEQWRLSFCQKLSKLVEIWRNSDKNNFAQFFWDTVYILLPNLIVFFITQGLSSCLCANIQRNGTHRTTSKIWRMQLISLCLLPMGSAMLWLYSVLKSLGPITVCMKTKYASVLSRVCVVVCLIANIIKFSINLVCIH